MAGFKGPAKCKDSSADGVFGRHSRPRWPGRRKASKEIRNLIRNILI